MTVSGELIQQARAIGIADSCQPLVRVELPLSLPSVANQRQHWAEKAEATKAKRDAVRLALTQCYESFEWVPYRLTDKGPLVVLLTRIAPRPLDSDNLARALKAPRDAVAEWLGVDDGDERVTWLVDQERRSKTQALRVEVFRG